MPNGLKYHNQYYGNYGSFFETGPRFPGTLNLKLVDDNMNEINLNGNYWTIDIFAKMKY
jgi:hypothetical protein